MLFVEWWLVGRICLGASLIALPVLAVWLVRNNRWPVRIPVRVLSVLLLLCGLFLLIIVVALPSPHAYSVPAYSPSRSMAARIDNYSAGPLGGAYDSIELFTSHGLASDVVYSGEFESVRAEDVRWKSNSELEIYYDGATGDCKSTQLVSVRCIRKQHLEKSR
jgi:hypothetical protein